MYPYLNCVTTLLCHFCLSEVDARHTSGLFIIQGELEDLSRGGRIFKNRGHERVMRRLVMDGIAESVPRMQLVFDPAPFLAFQSYWERTIRLGWTQLLSWNSPLLHMTTVVILYDMQSCNTETYTLVYKFPRKICGAAHAQTLCTRHSLQFFKCLGTRLSAHFSEVSKWLVAQRGSSVLVVCYQKVVANRPSLLTMYLRTLLSLLQGSRVASWM